MIKYLTTEQVLLIHDDMVHKFGGSHGIRDLGLVESAVARPQAGFGDFEAYPDLFLKAAVLIHSLLKNHAFIDGNKRTSTTAAEMFLWQNGYEIDAKKNEIYNLAMAVEDNSLPEDKIAEWLKKHSKMIK